jgi:predicted exporter
MTSRGRAALLVSWIAVVLLLGLYVQRELQISGDLRLFMPSPKTPVERLLLEEVGEGPASRLLLVALEGADVDSLAQSSQELAAALRADQKFRLVANGESSPDALPDELLPYRYLLSRTLDHENLDARFLREQLEERQRDLASPAAGLLESWIPRDPTLEALKLLEAWQPAREPQHIGDVWFNAKGDSALLLVETAAAAFDPDGQEAAVQALQKHFETARAKPSVRMIVSGPGAFSVLMKARTQNEAQWIGTIDTVGIIVLLLIAYRSVRYVVLGVLPLASAGVAGLAAVGAFFGAAHGITIAFGFTLIGVAQDYPIHLFSHQHPGQPPLHTARSVWPTLATGVASTCIAYLAFLSSGVIGLAQLACFTITGLAVASLTTRYLLPRLLLTSSRDYGESRFLERLNAVINSVPHPRFLASIFTAICIGVIVFVPGSFWQNDLGRLTPVPRPLLERDAALRAELGAPDVRYLLAVNGETADEVLTRVEALTPRLDALVKEGAIAAYDEPARYLPSAGTQQRRRGELPDPQTLQTSLQTALQGLSFRAEAFAPFLKDVEKARHLEPLAPASLAETPLALRVGGMLLERDGRWTGLVTFVGVKNPVALAHLTSTAPERLRLLDLKQASEDLVAHQRQYILWSLGIAALLLVAVVWIALRSVSRARRVLLPMMLTTFLILAVLHASGVSLTLFHLIALVLAAGLGLDYALFFEHASHDPVEQRRTLHAVIVCSVSTLLVFTVLAFSTLPVLRAIGVTVALGVIGNFFLALLFTRPTETLHARA